MNRPDTTPEIFPDNLRIAVISSNWHAMIVKNAVHAIEEEFTRSGFPGNALSCFEVPGAFEIPLHALQLARSGACNAIIACGLVVDGGIYRHEFVASAVITGLMQVQLQTGIPVFSAVLTPQQFHDHQEHREFFADHFHKKGIEVARACIETTRNLAKIRQTTQPTSHSGLH